MLKQIRPAIVSLIAFTIITGLVYPAVVTGFARVMYPRMANGGLISINGKPIGSELIAQGFTSAKYFWPRPSAAGYTGAGASGSNLGPSNPALVDAIKQRIEALRAADPENGAPIPVDLITASGSGLDPHISPAAAEYQASRVSKARNLSIDQVRAAIARHTCTPLLGIIGESRVNVLTLNIELDHPELGEQSKPHHAGMFRGMGFEP